MIRREDRLTARGTLTKAWNKTKCCHKKWKGHTSEDFRKHDFPFRFPIQSTNPPAFDDDCKTTVKIYSKNIKFPFPKSKNKQPYMNVMLTSVVKRNRISSRDSKQVKNHVTRNEIGLYSEMAPTYIRYYSSLGQVTASRTFPRQNHQFAYTNKPNTDNIRK